MPSFQGDLDGLCGPYAIVNAFEHCGIDRAEEIFTVACEALARRRWPRVLWEGTTIGDLKRMINLCREIFDDAQQVKVSYPFSRKTPVSNAQYWQRFDQIFKERPEARCMILGLTRPNHHWIVAVRETPGRVSFVDTDWRRPFTRKNRSMLHAGVRNGHPSKWIIDRGLLILFEAR